MKNLAFNLNDLMMLQQLGEYHLYLLNVALVEAASIAKSNWPSRTEAYQAFALAETAAKELACRNRWSPKLSDGEYSTGGITYDTPEYRNWINSYRIRLNDSPSSNILRTSDTYDLLEKFSFGDSIFEIKRTA